MKRKVLEQCVGSKSPVYDHKLANVVTQRYRVCRHCDKILQERKSPKGVWLMPVHGRYLSTQP